MEKLRKRKLPNLDSKTNLTSYWYFECIALSTRTSHILRNFSAESIFSGFFILVPRSVTNDGLALSLLFFRISLIRVQKGAEIRGFLFSVEYHKFVDNNEHGWKGDHDVRCLHDKT